MGGDIYIHGNAKSIGCLAMGDPAIEEIFPLVAAVGLMHCTILISPTDLRTDPIPPTDDPSTRNLYARMKMELNKFS